MPLLAAAGSRWRVSSGFPWGLSDSASSQESLVSERSEECKNRAKRLCAAVITEELLQFIKNLGF